MAREDRFVRANKIMATIKKLEELKDLEEITSMSGIARHILGIYDVSMDSGGYDDAKRYVIAMKDGKALYVTHYLADRKVVTQWEGRYTGSSRNRIGWRDMSPEAQKQAMIDLQSVYEKMELEEDSDLRKK